MSIENPIITIKIVAVGESGVGKSSIINLQVQDKLPSIQETNLVFDSKAKTIKYQDKDFNLSLWDTGAKQTYDSLRPMSYAKCDIFMIIFSIADQKQSKSYVTKWYNQVNSYNQQAIKIFVGNKIDLRGQPGQNNFITKDKAKKQIETTLKRRYYECSALKNEGIKQLFHRCIIDYVRQKKPILHKQLEQKRKVTGCCNLI